MVCYPRRPQLHVAKVCRDNPVTGRLQQPEIHLLKRMERVGKLEVNGLKI